MKTLFILCIVALVGCCTPYEPQSAEPSSPILVSIEGLQQQWGSMQNPVIKDNYIIEATVTTSDSASNFYRSFIVDDASAALEVACGFYDTYSYYKVGYRVRINLEGLTLVKDRTTGIYRLGLVAKIQDKVDGFGHRAVADKYIDVISKSGDYTVLDRRIEDITTRDIARTVRLKNLRFCAEDCNAWVKAEAGDMSDGVAKFCDPNNDTIRVVTSRYASFADGVIPSDAVDITGVLLWDNVYDNNGYYLKINDEKSVVEN